MTDVGSAGATAWDAVVVGGGHNGLVAAVILARRGWRVLVLEAQNVAGGAVRHAELTSPGFVTDLFSAFYPLGAISPVLRSLRLERHGLRWVRAPHVLTHLLPDGGSARISTDVSLTAASVDRHHRGDGAAWAALHERWAAVSDPLLTAFLGPFPPVRSTAALVRRAGAPELLRLARIAASSSIDFAQHEFAGAGAQALIVGNGLHADIPPTASGSAALGLIMSMVGQDVGFPVPQGGAGALTAALLSALRSAGGQVRLGTAVVEVVVHKGRAAGVVDERGTFYGAERAVLADVAAPTLFNDLIGADRLPPRLSDDLSRFTWDHATVKVNWALDRPIPWSEVEAHGAGTVHLGADVVGMADYANDLETDRVPEHPFVLLGQMTTTDPTRSPAGTESVWAYSHLPRSRSFGAADVAGQVRRIEDLVERHAPGFGERILARSVQGPADLQADDANLVEGAINAGTTNLWQQVVFRPTPGLGRPETFVDRLYLAGATAHPGGGVHGAAGGNAAAAALSRQSWARRPASRLVQRTQRALS
jgi:phytoene dehydrogenase-like protein